MLRLNIPRMERKEESDMENEKKSTPGKIALAVAFVVVLAAALIAVVVTGLKDNGAEAAVETAAVTEATIPADGNPDDETAKGSYTASDEAVIANRDTVVARLGDRTLTNGQLQVGYWMEVQSFLSSYGSYAAYFGLDYTQPLDTQVCGIAENGCTWQQFFLASALNSWKNYQSLAAEAEAAQFRMEDAYVQELDGIAQQMEENAQLYGMESGDALLQANVGAGATMEDYIHYMQLYYSGNLYFDWLCEAHTPTDAEIEAYFTENEEAYKENGLERDDKYVSVRHILIMPEGADSSTIRSETFDDAAWATSEAKAQEVLALFEAGDGSEDSFAQLAMLHSQDGNASDGGLYTDVYEGQMVEPFENWCFDADRKAGDSGIVKTDFGYHVMYFVSSRPAWTDTVKSEMMSNRANELLNGILENYTMEADFANINLAYVNMGGDSSDDAAEEPAVKESLFDAKNVPVLIIAAVSLVALMTVAYVFDRKDMEK